MIVYWIVYWASDPGFYSFQIQAKTLSFATPSSASDLGIEPVG